MDESCIAINDVEEDMEHGWETKRKRIANNSKYNLVEDGAREMVWWACFNTREGYDQPPKLASAGIKQNSWTQELKESIREAVKCHFDENEIPRIIRLHFVKEEVITT